MREPSPMKGEEQRVGITLSRTQIPRLPHGFLSRRHLFPLVDCEAPGTTLVIAPAGYGKTTLIAEWAQSQPNNVIWMTIANGDTLNEMSAMMISATRHILPEFAPWFEHDQPLRPTEVVRRWGNELLQTGRQFTFVLDVIRNESSKDIEIANQLIEQFPSNVHFIAIRRDEIESIYATCASRGLLKIVNATNLRFTEDEIDKLSLQSQVELNKETRKSVLAAHGWPSATSLLLAHIQVHGEAVDLDKLMSSTVEPIRALAMLVLEGTNPDVVRACEYLSILPNFNLDQAKLILGNDYSYEIINRIALDGEIFTFSRDPQIGYVFSPMLRALLLERLRKKPELKIEIHRKLIQYFESVGSPSAAIEHAFESEDAAKISELFPSATRIMQAQGRGGEILRWARFAGASPIDGELKKSTVLAAGYLADLDFGSARAEIEKLRTLAPSSADPDFYSQFAVAATTYSEITLGNFDQVEENIESLGIKAGVCKLGIDDQINLLRILATKRYIYNDAGGVEEIYLLSQRLAGETNLFTSHTFLLSIQAMHFHQRGEYMRAFEVASIAVNQYQKYGFVGNHGPLDVLFVAARCLLEFSKIQEGLGQLERIRASAYQWKQWHWYFACDKHIIEFLSYSGNQKEGLERIKRSREFASSIEVKNHLEGMIDINEMPLRRRLNDFDRLEVLINRAPQTRETHQHRMAFDEFKGKKSFIEDSKNLPERTPRDLIWKQLMEASSNIEVETIALAAIHKAMQIGAEVGARETFLRQRDAIGNLIIRIANDFPTVYNESLATAMAERMRERGVTMTTGHQSLTKRELEILRQLSTGRTLTVIAAELHISQNTMKTHLKNLYKKLEVDGRHSAIEKAKALFLL